MNSNVKGVKLPGLYYRIVEHTRRAPHAYSVEYKRKFLGLIPVWVPIKHGCGRRERVKMFGTTAAATVEVRKLACSKSGKNPRKRQDRKVVTSGMIPLTNNSK